MMKEGGWMMLEVGVGSNEQNLHMLVDTTNSQSWGLSPSIDTSQLKDEQDPYAAGSSSTFNSDNAVFEWSYFSNFVNGTEGGYDTMKLSDDITLSDQYIGLSNINPYIISEQILDGVLALGRQSTTMDSLIYISMDVNNNKLFFGEYPDSLEDIINMTVSRRIPSLKHLWTFELDEVYIPSATDSPIPLAACPCLGVVDLASPYIAVSTTPKQYEKLWSSVGTQDNCDITTLECEDTDKITPYIKFIFHNSTIQLDKANYISESQLLFTNLSVIDSEIPVFYFGRPFLQNLIVSLHSNVDDKNKDWIMISSPKSTESKPWITILIVLCAVLAFAIVFFAVAWRLCKIPPSNVRRPSSEQEMIQHHQQSGQQLGTSAWTQPLSEEDIRTRRLQALQNQSE